MPIVKVRHTYDKRGKHGLFTFEHGDGVHTSFDPGQVKNVDLTNEQVTALKAGQIEGLAFAGDPEPPGPDQNIGGAGAVRSP